MKKSFIQSIIDNKTICYFISPHFDDAVFSSGAIMRYLSRYTKIVVVNVFTRGGKKPYTLSANTYLKQCGYNDAQKLFVDREAEDAKVFTNLADTVINLGFVDALYRKKPEEDLLSKVFGNIAELKVLYPTYRFHIVSGNVAKKDVETIVQIKKKLSEIVTTNNSVVFCPLGVGNHIDHVITKIASEKLATQIIYWSDFPYNLHATLDTSALESFHFDQDLKEKEKLIQGYVSQYEAMFKEGLYLSPEEFYFQKK